jgi:membrane protease YdiL (CAAX protease family)
MTTTTNDRTPRLTHLLPIAWYAVVVYCGAHAIGIVTASVRILTGPTVAGKWIGIIVTLAVSVAVLAMSIPILRSPPKAYIEPRRHKSLIAIAASLIVGGVAVAHWYWAGMVRQQLPDGTEGLSVAAYLITAWVIQPAVLEEVGCRAFFQPRVHALLGPRWAIGLSTILFVAFHAYPSGVETPLWFIAIGGLAFGWVMHSTRSLVAAVSAHALANAISLLAPLIL